MNITIMNCNTGPRAPTPVTRLVQFQWLE